MTEATALRSTTGGDADEFLRLEGLRHALRRLGGGVTIVATTDAEKQPCGLMMTAVMSLTFSPPSMLIAVNRAASALPALLARGCFSISLIGAGDVEMCTTFAAADAESRFVAAQWGRHPTGLPVYRRAIATIICDVDDTQVFGTHMLVRGLVRDAAYSQSTAALIHLDGRFCRATADE